MFSNKARELQRQLEERDGEIRDLRARLEEYQLRSEAVVSALTDAKAVAGRIIAEAEEKSRAMMAENDALHAAAAAECSDMISRANEDAANIRASAEAEYRRMLEKAGAEADDIIKRAEHGARAADERAEELKKYIRETAEAARRQAEGYEAFLSECVMPPAPVQQETSGGPLIQSQDESPAEVMRNIYAMEGRRLPDEMMGDAQEEDMVWTVDQVLRPGEFAAADNGEGVASLDDQLNDIINDILELD